jgi:hypothetical protein
MSPRAIGDVIALARPKQSPAYDRRRYRGQAVFVTDPLAHSTRLDRNQRARIIAMAEGLERRSKPAGKRSGILGLTGLQVLRALLFAFHRRDTGLCAAAYSRLQAVTGFCRQTICRAIRALEAAGIIRVVRRLVRRQVTRECPITGRPQTFLTTAQDVNLYNFPTDPKPLPIARLIVGKARSFPRPDALLALLFKGLHPSPLSRGKPTSGRIPSESSAPAARVKGCQRAARGAGCAQTISWRSKEALTN